MKNFPTCPTPAGTWHAGHGHGSSTWHGTGQERTTTFSCFAGTHTPTHCHNLFCLYLFPLPHILPPPFLPPTTTTPPLPLPAYLPAHLPPPPSLPCPMPACSHPPHYLTFEHCALPTTTLPILLLCLLPRHGRFRMEGMDGGTPPHHTAYPSPTTYLPLCLTHTACPPVYTCV